ncbi:hypothetical protein QUB17_21205 [Microcoleus sp. B5-C4]|uniref:hypothetical protein n=1 Tax=Microcoleus sp. B5-C4 TaxID=2818675 RepID=UPI002FD1AD48
MNRWKFRRNTSRLILVLASLLTLIIIVITGVSSYAITPDGAYIGKIEGTGLVIGVGNNPDRKPASEGQQLEEPNQVLYVPGGNKPWANLGFFEDSPKEHTGLLVKAGPSPTPSEWSFPCSARGRFTIAWKKGSDRGCEPEGVKLQRSSSNRGGLPNNNLQASRRLLAQAEDEVTVVPTPGQSTIQTADTFTGISVSVLVGDVRVKSARNPGGRLVKAGERYDYPQDTITPIDPNPILNSPEMQEFLNPNNWRSPNIPQRIADGFSEQLGEIQTALGKGAPAVASNSGNNSNSAQPPLNQSPQRTASQSTQPQPQAEDPIYTAPFCFKNMVVVWFLGLYVSPDQCGQSCGEGRDCHVSTGTFLPHDQNQVLVNCEGYSQTFVGIGSEPLSQARDAVSSPNYKPSCTFRVIGSPPEPPQPITP